MTYFDAIILGLVQGLTEFIPISSSGHLVLVRDVFGIEGGGLFFDVVLHLGTLLAVLIYFRKDIWSILSSFHNDRKLFWMIVIGTIPAVFFGFLFADTISSFGESPVFTSSALILTASFFLIAEKLFARTKKEKVRSFDEIKLKDAIIIGLMQSFALIPGVSRSGTTIATGIIRGIDRKNAARFSFLLSIPAITGAGVYTTYEAFKANHLLLDGQMIAGFVISFVSGFFAIAFLLKFLEKYGLAWFAGYLIIVGTGLLIFFSM